MADLTVIAGPMFSGKSEELIRMLRRFDIVRKKILAVKPKIDTRTHGEIASRRKPDRHSATFEKGEAFPALTVDSREDIVHLINSVKPSVIGIDETQFFEPWLVGLIDDLLSEYRNEDLSIIAAGLDMDAWRKPFGCMPQLLAMADRVIKVTAVCFRCKVDALFTQKLGTSSQQVEVGDTDIYEARCRRCHTIPL